MKFYGGVGHIHRGSSSILVVIQFHNCGFRIIIQDSLPLVDNSYSKTFVLTRCQYHSQQWLAIYDHRLHKV